MAITDIDAYAHLTAADIEALGAELDAIRRDIEESRGERDARDIRRAVALHRGLAVGGRVTQGRSDLPGAGNGIGTAVRHPRGFPGALRRRSQNR